MKENQVEKCQKHKKSFTPWFNQKKAWRGVLKIDARGAAKHKIILSWSKHLRFY